MSSQGVYVGNVNQYITNTDTMVGGFKFSASKSLWAKAKVFKQPPALMHFAKHSPQVPVMAECLSKRNQDRVQGEQGSLLCEKSLVSSCSVCVYLKTEHILEMTSYCLLTFSESRALLASLGSSRACCQHSTWREVREDSGHSNSPSVSLKDWM